ncbi:MAG: peptidylprolyl isomerase [Syntrophomonadaceae bacterium]|jgi:parvulin-like peptidyl-prolyl isomerase|nr:peptidylprolyl isomerase [Bacillota bacterium]NLM88076.1 hypothetical protein [Syntrophomonadaceae bacterium]HAA08809.1 hypothetical protein [Syntrophomonas sp.]
MHKKTHYLVLALTLILALFMLNGCQEKNQEQTIGEVNGEAITEKQFEQHYRLVLNYYEQTYGKIDEKKEPELVTNLKDSSFEDLVVQKLILQEAKKRGIEADLKQVEQDLAFIREQRNQLEENGYQKFMDDNGFDEEFLKQEWITQNLYIQLRNDVTSEVKISEEECQAYYEENKDVFKHPAGKEIFHILVEDEDKAEEVLAQLDKGDSFSELAAEYSIDPGSRTRGGDVGVVNEDTNFVEPFKEAALKLPPGELLTTPVKSDYGYHIIKAGEQLEEGIWPYSKVQADIQAALLMSKQDEVFNQFLEDLRANAEIKDYRK